RAGPSPQPRQSELPLPAGPRQEPRSISPPVEVDPLRAGLLQLCRAVLRGRALPSRYRPQAASGRPTARRPLTLRLSDAAAPSSGIAGPIRAAWPESADLPASGANPWPTPLQLRSAPPDSSRSPSARSFLNRAEW